MAPQSSSMWRIDEPITFGQLETGKHTKKQTNTRLRSIIYRSQSMIIGPTWLRNPPRYCHAAKWIRRSLFLFYDATYKRATSTKKRKWKNSTWTSGATTHGRVCVCVTFCVTLAWIRCVFFPDITNEYPVAELIDGRRTRPGRGGCVAHWVPNVIKKRKTRFPCFVWVFLPRFPWNFSGRAWLDFSFLHRNKWKWYHPPKKEFKFSCKEINIDQRKMATFHMRDVVNHKMICKKNTKIIATRIRLKENEPIESSNRIT